MSHWDDSDTVFDHASEYVDDSVRRHVSPTYGAAAGEKRRT